MTPPERESLHRQALLTPGKSQPSAQTYKPRAQPKPVVGPDDEDPPARRPRAQLVRPTPVRPNLTRALRVAHCMRATRVEC